MFCLNINKSLLALLLLSFLQMGCQIEKNPTLVQENSAFKEGENPVLLVSKEILQEDLILISKGYSGTEEIFYHFSFEALKEDSPWVKMNLIFFDEVNNSYYDWVPQQEIIIEFSGSVRTTGNMSIEILEEFKFQFDDLANEIVVATLNKTAFSPHDPIVIKITGEADVLKEISENSNYLSVKLSSNEEFRIETNNIGEIRIIPENYWKILGEHRLYFYFLTHENRKVYSKRKYLDYKIGSEEVSNPSHVEFKEFEDKSNGFLLHFDNTISLETIQNKIKIYPHLSGEWIEESKKVIKWRPHTLSSSIYPKEIFISSGILNPISKKSSTESLLWESSDDFYQNFPYIETITIDDATSSTLLYQYGSKIEIFDFPVKRSTSESYKREITITFSHRLDIAKTYQHLGRIQLTPVLPSNELTLPQKDNFIYSPDSRKIHISYHFKKRNSSDKSGIYKINANYSIDDFINQLHNIKVESTEFYIREVFHD